MRTGSQKWNRKWPFALASDYDGLIATDPLLFASQTLLNPRNEVVLSVTKLPKKVMNYHVMRHLPSSNLINSSKKPFYLVPVWVLNLFKIGYFKNIWIRLILFRFIRTFTLTPVIILNQCQIYFIYLLLQQINILVPPNEIFSNTGPSMDWSWDCFTDMQDSTK